MSRSSSPEVASGKVYLVGAGPGALDLLTLRAARLLEQAEAVVYDNLVGDGIVDLAPATARRIYVGKKSSNHTLPQPEISQLLVELAREGLRVVRLKGGDPFIFGRGGEELEVLAAAGIAFEVVPGITAAAGCAAQAGFPLTHRDHAQSLTLVTAHLQDNTVNLDWDALARPAQTVVFYMGVSAARAISEQMIAHGLSHQTPAAVVHKGTLPDQLTLISTLGRLPDDLARAAIKPPALIIVGEVVGLATTLQAATLN